MKPKALALLAVSLLAAFALTAWWTLPAFGQPLAANADFTQAVVLVDEGATSVLYADLNSDGVHDLLSVLAGEERTRIYLGQHGESYTLAGALRGFQALAAGDLDNDGDYDLLGQGSGLLLGLLNDGRANFPSVELLDCEAAGVLCIGPASDNAVLFDFDLDGDLEIAAAGELTPVILYSREAAPNDNVWLGQELDFNASSLAAGDLDGDGLPDLAAAYRALSAPYTTTLKVYHQTGGSFSLAHFAELAPATFISSETPPEMRGAVSLALGDLNGDGDLDLAAALSAPLVCSQTDERGGVLLITNHGSGSFSSSRLMEGNVSALALGDLDGDGDLDLAAAASPAYTCVASEFNYPDSIFYNDGAGNFDLGDTLESDFSLTNDLTMLDSNNDGALDLLVAHQLKTQVYLNPGARAWPPAQQIMTGFPPDADGAVLADLDGNGYLDVLSAPGATIFPFAHPHEILWNDGAGSLQNGLAERSTIGAPQELSRPPFAFDVDGDGDLDLVLSAERNGNPDTPRRLYRNLGNRQFELVAEFTAGSDGRLAAGDLDSDGDLELVAPGMIFRNDGGSLTATQPFTPGLTSVALGDIDGDGDLDAAGAAGDRLWLFVNLSGSFHAEMLVENVYLRMNDVLLADLNGDGRIDIIGARDGLPHLILFNHGAGGWQQSAFGIGAEQSPKLAAGDLDNDGDLDMLVAAMNSPLAVYTNNGQGDLRQLDLTATAGLRPTSATLGDVDGDGDLDILVASAGNGGPFYGGVFLLTNPLYNRAVRAQYPPLLHPGQPSGLPGQAGPAPLGFGASPAIHSSRVISIPLLLSDPDGSPVARLSAEYSLDGGGVWQPALPAAGAPAGNLATWPPQVHLFAWDTFASGFFGSSEHLLLRFHAWPGLLPEPFARQSGQTLAFRARGAQVRVVDADGQPVAGATVYRQPAGQAQAGELIGDGAGRPFRTDTNGYLSGRGALALGDSLLARQWITSTATYSLYHTNGAPTPLGLAAHQVSSAGVQTLTVSPANPLFIFDLDVSLEWDASQDSLYLEQLTANLRRASAYLYDFSDGQMALGQVNIYQNRDYWDTAHIIVQASNRLRPWAVEGGVVITHTAAPFSPTLTYSPGQLAIGSVWNRYGNPGQSMGEDWPIILAHELGHYLLFLDDVYLGLDPETGLLIPVNTCRGSAMGDPYTDPANTEFIFDHDYWNANCANTLANQMLGRPEWEVMQAWYPELRQPLSLNPGPANMPFAFTNVRLHSPYTATQALLDPIFYIVYEDGRLASGSARGYLEKPDQRLLSLGGPFGGQNRLAVRGAEAGDRLCVFDSASSHFGCESITPGDDVLALRQDASWNPIISLTPISSDTLQLQVSQSGAGPLELYARLFPDYGLAYPPVALAYHNGVYSASLHLREVTVSGALQLYVANDAYSPRRETVLPFTVGGNPGYTRGGGSGGGFLRGPGYTRGGGSGGGSQRSGNAPLLSPDGNLIFFTRHEISFTVGTLFTVQSMAGLPPPPPGRTLLGQGYQIIASPGANLPQGSISIQYAQNDVALADAQESDLALYYYDGITWLELATTLDSYYNLASAPSHGAGVYALFASVRLPLAGPGWNLLAYPLRQSQPVTQALASVAGAYSIVYQGQPAASDQPWRLYDPAVPPTFQSLVNSLSQMQFGGSYWLYATQSITAHFGGAPLTPINALALPPAVFYGRIPATPGFTPAAGLTLRAYVNGVLCGQAMTQLSAGQVVYSLQVAAAGSQTACGQPGSQVRFELAGRPLSSAPWQNQQANRFDLHQPIFLPLMRR